MARTRSIFSRHFLMFSLFCISTVVVGVKSFLFAPSPAGITPSDSGVFFGERLKVQCTLKTSPYNASQLYFKITAGNNIWEVPKENMTVVDDKTAFTWIEISQSTHSTNPTTYECMRGAKSLASTLVYPDYPIQEVTNFTGIYYEHEKGIIQWRLPFTYLFPESINITTVWNANGPVNQSGTMCDVSTNERCVIEYKGNSIIYIRVSLEQLQGRPTPEYIQNEMPAKAISDYRFVVVDNFKRKPVEEFAVVSKNTTCLNITWKDPQPIGDFISWYQVQVKNENKEESDFVVRPPFIPEEKPFALCSLEPYTTYSLRLQIKLQSARPDLWSDPVEQQTVTDEDRPVRGPTLLPTSYTSGQCSDNRRRVSVYWNAPQANILRGELTKYKVTYGESSALIRPGYNYFPAELDCNASSRISISMATKVGFSVKPSNIDIPSEVDALQVPQTFRFKVEEIFNSGSSLSMDTKNVTSSWNSSALEREDVKLFLYWCQESYTESVPACFDDFKVKEVNVREKEIILSDLPVTDNLFGYALMNERGSVSGIEWTDCIFQSDLSPDKPTDVEVRAGSESGSLIVSWYAPRCNKKTKILILEYKLYICEGQPSPEEDLQHHCKVHTIDSLEGTVFELKNLKMSQQYRIFVQSVSPKGSGRLSDPADGATESSESNTQELVMIVLLVVVGFALLMLIVSAVFWRCRKSKKYYDNLIKADNEFLDELSPRKLTSENSQESGFGTGSSNGNNSSSLKDVPGIPSSIPPPLVFSPQESAQPQESSSRRDHDAEHNAEETEVKTSGKISDGSTPSSSENSNNISDAYSKFGFGPSSLCSGKAKSSSEVGNPYSQSDLDGSTYTAAEESSSSILMHQLSVDEGFSSPATADIQNNFEFNLQGNELHGISNSLMSSATIPNSPAAQTISILSVRDDPDFHHRKDAIAALKNNVCENSNEKPLASKPKKPSAMAEIQDPQNDTIDPSSYPSNQTLADYFTFGDFSVRSPVHPDGHDSDKNQTSMTEHEILQSNKEVSDVMSISPDDGTTSHCFISGHENFQSDGYRSHSFMENHQDVQSDGYKPQSFMENNQDVPSGGYKSQSFMENHQDASSDGSEPLRFMENHQDASSDGSEPLSFMENHQDVAPDGIKNIAL